MAAKDDPIPIRQELKAYGQRGSTRDRRSGGQTAGAKLDGSGKPREPSSTAGETAGAQLDGGGGRLHAHEDGEVAGAKLDGNGSCGSHARRQRG